MKNKWIGTTMAFTLVFGLTSTANAALIGVVDHDAYFTDTTNGLDWLDVTTSVNRSHNDISSQLGAGGDFVGWRYATMAEFSQMIDSTTGLATGVSAFAPPFYNENELFAELINLFGDTLDNWAQSIFGKSYDEQYGNPLGSTAFTFGLLADAQQGLAVRYRQAKIADYDANPTDLDWVDISNAVSPDSKSEDYGSYLVRGTNTSATVSTSATLPLIAIGMIGLIALRRRTPTSQ